MDTFSEKVKRKKELDAKKYTWAANIVYRPLLAHKDAGQEERIHERLEVTEVCRILDYFKLQRPQFIKEQKEIEQILAYAGNETGMMRRKVMLKGDWWKHGAAPLLCFDQNREVHALLPDAWGGYIYYDQGKKVHVTKKHAAVFLQNCYCFYAPFGQKPMDTKEFLWCLCRAFQPSDILWLFGISFLVGLLGLIMPCLYHFVFYSVIPSGTTKELAGIAVLIIGSVVIMALGKLARALWVMRIGNKMELLAQNAIWERMLSLPADFFRSYSSGELANRAEAVNQVCSILGGQLLPMVLGFSFSFLYLFQIGTMSQALLLPSFLVVFLMLAVQLFSAYLQIRRTEHNNRIENKLSGAVFELLNGLTKIKVSGAEIRAFQKWSELYQQLQVLPGTWLTVSGAVSHAVSFGGTIFLYFCAYRADMSASDYIAFHAAFSLFTGAVLSFADISTQFASLRPALNLLEPILAQAPEKISGQKQVTSLRGEIELAKVKFRYAENLPYVLNEMDLKIKAGEYIGIVGASGCGKSTLLRILLGFETPQFGAVYYDMKDMKGMDVRSLRRRIGVVLQDGKLFAGDIYSNIVVCAPWLSVEDAWAAAEKSGLAEDIKRMPMGMFTMLSESGGGLSGGQKQRLLIARALAADPDIIMFDEATSALDNLTQAMVVETLSKMTCTRLVIAHRLSTIRQCSRIIYLENGKIAEEGTYEELLALGGKFSKSAKRQMI